MKFIYKTDDVVKSEYEVVYLDKNDNKIFTYVIAYSEKQAQFYVTKKYPDCYRVLRVNQIREIPDDQGKQMEMDFNSLK